jgi:hypothetical protein
MIILDISRFFVDSLRLGGGFVHFVGVLPIALRPCSLRTSMLRNRTDAMAVSNLAAASTNFIDARLTELMLLRIDALRNRTENSFIILKVS